MDNHNDNYYDIKNEVYIGKAKAIKLKTLNEIARAIVKIIITFKNEIFCGTGFFMEFPKNKIINCLISNEHIISEEIIDSRIPITIELENKKQYIMKLDKRFIKSFKSPIDITLIEVLDCDLFKKEVKFLKIDFNYLHGYKEYIGKNVFILQHMKGDDTQCSIGKIIGTKNFEFEHNVDTDLGSSGSPVILIENLNVIGIHKGGSKNRKVNCGAFISILFSEIGDIPSRSKEVIIYNNDNLKNENNNELINVKNNINKKEDENKNELIMRYKINNFLIKILGEYFVEHNQNNFKLLVNGKEHQFCSFIYKKEIQGESDILEIKLIKMKNTIDISYMFDNCKDLMSIEGLADFNTDGIVKMRGIFKGCSLSSLPDISKWNTINVSDMSFMFTDCISLINLPDISKWNTNNVRNMKEMFYNCKQLKVLPDISNWNTSNVFDMSYMFHSCISLESLPDLSKWDLNKTSIKCGIFYGCKNLNIPDKFN